MIAAKLNPGEVGVAGTQFGIVCLHVREGGKAKMGKRRERRERGRGRESDAVLTAHTTESVRSSDADEAGSVVN